MYAIQFKVGDVSAEAQAQIAAGFSRHAKEKAAPEHQKQRLSWVIHDDDKHLCGALTADLLWDWLYVDELWVDHSVRGQGQGRRLMAALEAHGRSLGVTGIWLWTQSWQAAEFYEHLKYEEFTRFPGFPKGHTRIGYRKLFSA